MEVYARRVLKTICRSAHVRLHSSLMTSLTDDLPLRQWTTASSTLRVGQQPPIALPTKPSLACCLSHAAPGAVCCCVLPQLLTSQITCPCSSGPQPPPPCEQVNNSLQGPDLSPTYNVPDIEQYMAECLPGHQPHGRISPVHTAQLPPSE